MKKSFKICAISDEAGNTLYEQIKALKDNDISNIEIRNIDSQNISNISIENAKKIKKALDNNNISVFSIASPIGKIDVHEEFEQHVESYKKILEIADILEAKACRIFSFYIKNRDEISKYSSLVLERLFRLSQIETDVVLCHENEKGIFGDSSDRCIMIHKNIPKIKAVFDIGNFLQCGEDTLTAYNKLEEYVYYMHIKDLANDGTIVPAGEGKGNVLEIIKRFKGEYITIEPHLFKSEFCNFEKENSRSKVSKKFNNKREAFDVATIALKTLLDSNK